MLLHSIHGPYDDDCCSIYIERKTERRGIAGSRTPSAPYGFISSTTQVIQNLRRRSKVKFRIDRDVLADAVAWTARSLPVRPPVPVLAGMLIEAGDDLKLSSFDYEVSAQVTMDIDADEPGTALVWRRLRPEPSRTLPAAPVEITTDGAKVTLKCG